MKQKLEKPSARSREKYEVTFPGDPEHYFRYGQGVDQAERFARRAHNKKHGRLLTAYVKPEKIIRLA